MTLRVPTVLCLAGALLLSPAAFAQAPQEDHPAGLAATPEAETLDSLFADLKREPDPDAAQDIVDGIWAEWNDSGSATINLLMQWAEQAMAERRFATALDFLDQVTVLRPDFPEGWNRRATLHFMMNDYGKAMSDIEQVLALEPRHFGALSGLAAIMLDAGNEEMALEALRRALAVYPADRTLQEQLIQLEDELAGEPA